tara:strand:+ start:276 stop:428 length:153 start_codon:yes stop_codon:yes gene_type:complete
MTQHQLNLTSQEDDVLFRCLEFFTDMGLPDGIDSDTFDSLFDKAVNSEVK